MRANSLRILLLLAAATAAGISYASDFEERLADAAETMEKMALSQYEQRLNRIVSLLDGVERPGESDGELSP